MNIKVRRLIASENISYESKNNIAFMVKRIGNATVTVNKLIELTATDPEYRESLNVPYTQNLNLELSFTASASDKRALVVFHELIDENL